MTERKPRGLRAEAEVPVTLEHVLLRATLEAMIRGLAPRRQRDRRFLRRVGTAALVGGILVASCDGGNDTTQTLGTDADTDMDTDGDTDADSDADSDTDVDADSDTGTGTDPDAGPDTGGF